MPVLGGGPGGPEGGPDAPDLLEAFVDDFDAEEDLADDFEDAPDLLEVFAEDLDADEDLADDLEAEEGDFWAALTRKNQGHTCALERHALFSFIG